MGRIQSLELVSDYIDFLMSGKVAVQDIHSGCASLGVNLKARPVQWDYIKANWQTLRTGKIGSNNIVLGRILQGALTHFSSHEAHADISNFFADKDTTGIDRGLNVVLDTIKGAASYKARDEALILEWLDAHKYV